MSIYSTDKSYTVEFSSPASLCCPVNFPSSTIIFDRPPQSFTGIAFEFEESFLIL
jgi:hypothetical protein